MTPSARRALLGTVLVGAVAVAGLLVSPAATAAAVERLAADPVAFGAVVVGLYLVRPLFAWPTTPLSFVAGYGLGVAVGVPVALTGILLTVIPPYLAVRWIVAGGDSRTDAVRTDAAGADATGADATGMDAAGLGSTGDAGAGTGSPGPVVGLFGGALNRAGTAISGYFETAGPLRGVVVARLLPIPSDVATCAAAVAGVRLRQLLAGTAVGELPWTVAAVVLGASAAQVTTAGLGAVGWQVAVACAIAAGLLLAGPSYRLLTDRPVPAGDAESGARTEPDAEPDPEW